MKNAKNLAGLIVAILLLSMSASAATVSVKWGTTYQEIDGFGASTFDGSYGTNQNLAGLFFDRDTGIGMSLIRINVAAAVGSSPSTADINSVKLALARNPEIRIFACPWSPPGAWKTNNSPNNGGELLAARYQDYANLLADWIDKIQAQGINLYAMSVQNEPDMNVSYNSCIWNPDQFFAFTKNYLKTTFVSRNLTTKIIVGDACAWDEKYAVPLLNDPVGVNAVDIVAGHPYCGEPTPLFPVTKSKGKRVWETEVSNLGANDASIADGLTWAQSIHHFIVENQANAWCYWNFAGRSNGESIVTSSTGINRRLWTIGNFSKFIRPGYIRIDASPANSGNVRVSAYRDPATGKFAIVAINSNGGIALTTFALDFSTTKVTPNVTTSTLNLAKQSDISVTGGSFTMNLPAQSVTTFSGVSGATVISKVIPARSTVSAFDYAMYDLHGRKVGNHADRPELNQAGRKVLANGISLGVSKKSGEQKIVARIVK